MLYIDKYTLEMYFYVIARYLFSISNIYLFIMNIYLFIIFWTQFSIVIEINDNV